MYGAAEPVFATRREGGCVHVGPVDELVEEALRGEAGEEGTAHKGTRVMMMVVMMESWVMMVMGKVEHILEGIPVVGIVDTSSAEEGAEDLEGVHRVEGEVPLEAGSPPLSVVVRRRAGVQAVLSVSVEGGPLVGVAQHLVGLRDLLELLLRVVGLVFIRMELQRVKCNWGK